MYKIDEKITVKITNITHYGFFFETVEKWKGLVHISEISDKYIYDINDYFKVDQEVDVMVMEVNEPKRQLKSSYKKANNNDLKEKEFNKKEDFAIVKEKLPKLVEETLDEIE